MWIFIYILCRHIYICHYLLDVILLFPEIKDKLLKEMDRDNSAVLAARDNYYMVLNRDEERKKEGKADIFLFSIIEHRAPSLLSSEMCRAAKFLLSLRSIILPTFNMLLRHICSGV